MNSTNFTFRINRIIGQLKGIERMMSGERECSEILQQISAVKKAIDSLSREIVLSDVNRFIARDEDRKQLAKVMDRMINL